MTSKKGQTLRIEAEIDKNREEGNWKKVTELAEQLRVLYPSNGKFSTLTKLNCQWHYCLS